MVLYIALNTSESDIFYQAGDSPDWEFLKSVYQVHHFPDTDKIVNAYLSFLDYIALGNAMISKQKDSDSLLANYVR
jgi:hypothetical protein